ncbi:unnamed protein product [Plutella xylostella]|uniref:(diamondback moth) hypothetical protein n=1 Tax=Plutella xylostella TaxID=51655 RepID=A0A8S4GD74_PLUXY|nr:unnamed protein product [Plutella xylostella]
MKMEFEKMIEDTYPNQQQTSLKTLETGTRPVPSSAGYTSERDACLNYFTRWNETDQVEFVEQLLARMCHYQHGHINAYLKPMLQRDFISLLPKKGLDHVAENILSYLDAASLCAAELVCREWQRVISEGMLWKKLVERKVRTDSLWRGLAERRGWIQYLFKPKPGWQHPSHAFYRQLFPKIIQDIRSIEDNWRGGRHNLQRINCRSENSKGVYCLQYDDNKIVSGLRDNTIKIWDRKTLQCVKELQGHTGSVLCLQYDSRAIISGSSDSTVRVWDVATGAMLNTLIHHCEAVLHLRFSNGMMVTCSKDRSIAVWDMTSTTEIMLRRVLVGHRAAVNVVDFDEKYIVSASGDRTIKRAWCSGAGHDLDNRDHAAARAGRAPSRRQLVDFDEKYIVSASGDRTIKKKAATVGIHSECMCERERGLAVRDMTSTTEIMLRRVLVGHRAAVNVVDFDEKYIVSASGDRTIKVWNTSSCEFVRTLNGHKRGIACLQYRDRLVVSGSSDNTIRLWDIECGQCIRVLEGHEELVRCIRASACWRATRSWCGAYGQWRGDTVSSGSSDNTIRLWDIECGQCIRVLEGHEELVRCIRASACWRATRSWCGAYGQWRGDTVSSGSSDNTIRLWDIECGQCIRVLEGHEELVRCIRASACWRATRSWCGAYGQWRGDTVSSGSSDNTIRLWDIECGQCIRVLEGHEELVRCIRSVAGLHGLWRGDTVSGEVHTARSAAIRFDNKRIVSGAYDGKIKVWDLPAALDVRTPHQDLCLRTLVVSDPHVPPPCPH